MFLIYFKIRLLMEFADEEERKCVTPQICKNPSAAKERLP